ncbi:hypothetical protein HMH01_14970 [Halovulum dunhuangense]|uniref:Tetratricopeptide repeat protein n=1 Tax=Halovulum dunhuangense TaxID=1505036 RepID=A0A849L6N3_9RHOB|nr:capsular polysaccharide synthesis protein [Halovulum dunhuangense]NNU81741.1 hypothetical protein [Halovulum dunhuangense]
MHASELVQSLWIGSNISRIEKISMQSFLSAGHEYHLYTYSEEPMDLPDGVVRKDAREIVPEHMVWHHGHGPEKGSVAGFSDYFRFQLLFQRGGVWADADLICVRPLPLDQEVLICSETVRPGLVQPSTQLLKFPAGDRFLAECIADIEARDVDGIAFLEVGPALVDRKVRELGYQKHVVPADYFCPVPWWEFYRPFIPGHAEKLMELLAREDVYCLHLWHELLRRIDIPKDAEMAKGSVIEQMAERFAVPSSPGRHDPREVQDFLVGILLANAEDWCSEIEKPEIERLVAEAAGINPADPRLFRVRYEKADLPEEFAATEQELARVPAEVARIFMVALARAQAARRFGRDDLQPVVERNLSDSALEAGPDATAEAAWHFLRRQDRESAASLLEEADALGFSSASLHVARGRHLQLSGKNALAEGSFRAALDLDGKTWNAALLLAEVLHSEGEHEAALPHAQSAADFQKTVWAFMVLARVQMALRNSEAAELALRSALELSGGANWNATRLLHEVLSQTGRPAEASELVSSYLANNPEDARALNWAARNGHTRHRAAG